MDDFTKIYVGKIELEEVRNIVREIKSLWSGLDNVWPAGKKAERAQIKVTRDAYNQYYVWMNDQALTYTLLFAKKIKPSEVPKSPEKPMPPGFLRDLT